MTVHAYMHRIQIRCLLELGTGWIDAGDTDPDGYDRIIEDEWDHEMLYRGIR